MTAWLDLVKKTMKEHKGKKFKEILQIAKKNYKPICKKNVSSKIKSRKSRRTIRHRGGEGETTEPVSTTPEQSVESVESEVVVGGKKRARKSRKNRH